MSYKELTEKMENKETRMTRGYSPELTKQIREGVLSNAVNAQIEALSAVYSRGGSVELADTVAVEAEVMEYFRACRDCYLQPTFEGLCAALGTSRQHVYAWTKAHPEHETTRFLASVRSSLVAIVEQLALSKTSEPAMSIFILKNSHMGFSDAPEQDDYKEDTRIGHKTSEQIAEEFRDFF